MSTVRSSLYRPISKSDVKAVYSSASRRPFDYQKADWGSEQSMLNRFRLGLRLIRWEPVQRWLDVGCGVGLFFHEIERTGITVKERIGVDITDELISAARSRWGDRGIRFVLADLETMPDNIDGCDLITMIGVLQSCGCRPEAAFGACIPRLRSGGQVFLTTKNLGWREFSAGALIPELGHSWFEYDEIAATLDGMGCKIISSGGILPREGCTVNMEDSHTMYVLARRV